MLVALALAQPAQEQAWTMELQGAPVAVVRASLRGRSFRWSAEHLFGRRERRAASVELGADGKDGQGRVPEGLWLWRTPKDGCVPGLDELSGRLGPLCARAVGPGRVDGTLRGEPFRAWYGADGTLDRLEVSGAAYRRGAAWAGEDPWRKGVRVAGQGPTLRLQPHVEGARVLPSAPQPSGRTGVPGDCLELARAAAGAGAEVVLGVVVEDGRAWPHAWVRDAASGREHDPSVPTGATPARTYVAFPRGRAGELYLALLDGHLAVERGP